MRSSGLWGVGEPCYGDHWYGDWESIGRGEVFGIRLRGSKNVPRAVFLGVAVLYPEKKPPTLIKADIYREKLGFLFSYANSGADFWQNLA